MKQMRWFRSFGFGLTLALLGGVAAAQVPGKNINMVSGTVLPAGDPYLQRQNEPSMAVSTRHSQHLLAGANDYRTVDIPIPPDSNQETGDAWVSVFSSLDGGLSWKSTLLPGYPQDQTTTGKNSVLHNYAVATDPTVRAGTHGMFYYSGLVFARGTNAPSGVFVSTLQDQNNKGNGNGSIQDPGDPTKSGNPFLYLNTTMVDTGTSGQFLDKPWIAVDIPRPGTIVGSAACAVNGKTFTSGNVYVFYTTFLGNTNPSSNIRVVTSKNCGKTWSKPVKVSQSSQLNQGTVATIDPVTGKVFVFWRQLGNGKNQADSILYSVSADGGNTWTSNTAYTFPMGTPFDENGTTSTFREVDLPAAASDGSGRIWLAFSLRNQGPLGTSRMMMTTLPPSSRLTANNWTTPYIADNSNTPGHQLMPALSFAYGKLMLTFLDNREDNTTGYLQCPSGQTCTKTSDLVEVRVPTKGSDLEAGNPAKVFSATISDAGMKVRHTIDVRGALVDPSLFNGTPLPFPTVRISQYPFGSRPNSKIIEQMKFNPPNFPMFVHGTKPFIGDYIDVAALSMVLDATGKWVFNTAPSNAAVFHTTWTDNRDVRPPPVTCDPVTHVCTQNWGLFTPVASTGGTSQYDPTQQSPACIAAQTGSRNQNVYTARFTQGLLVGIKENTKPLLNANGASIQRAFSVFVSNTTNQTAYYRLAFNPAVAPPTSASFSQSSSLLSVDLKVLARSTASRTVFVTSTLKYPSVSVIANQLNGIGAQFPIILPQNGGLQSTAVINPDNTNPDITNPDITNPDITNPDITNPDITNPDITNAEVYNPTVTNPDITNPDITNPDITNPDITNPDITNPDITNPDITNYTVTNPDITNPDITNPDITNPDITNPDITNPDITSLSDGVTDVTFKLSNKGNTSSSYSAKEFAKQVGVNCCTASSSGSCQRCQLIARKTYTTPIANACTLTVEAQNIPISNIPNPAFATGDVASPDNGSDSSDPSVPPSTTVSLSPGEGGRVTLRVFGHVDRPAPGSTPVKTVGVAGGANTGQTTPASSLTITTTALPVAVIGTNYLTNSGASSRLTSVGGTSALTWSTTQGSLPANITLNATNGQLSGPVNATPGSSFLTFKVEDTAVNVPNGPPVHNSDLQSLVLKVNRLSIASITAANTGTSSIYLSGKPGDSVTVRVTVANEGPATATNVVASALLITPTAAGTPLGSAPSVQCTGPVPLTPAQIFGNGTQEFDYTCTTTGGNGYVTFTANAAGQYATPGAGTVSASAAPVASNQITVDTTPPTLAYGAVSPTPNAAGWNNTVPVNIPYTTNDNLSGVNSNTPPSPVSFTSQGPNQTTVVTVFDNAGNKATFTSQAVNIDTVAPVISGSASPAPNGAGWNNTNVTVTFTCVDNVIGVASGVAAGSPTSPITLSTEGANQSANGTCTDVAGNVSQKTVSGINIDKTPPTLTYGAASPAANGAGWNNTNVSFAYTTNDNLSGVSGSTPPSPLVLTSEGSAVTGSVTVTDIAGNSAAFTSPAVKIDKTPPTLTYGAASPAANGAGWNNTNVAFPYTPGDSLSGVASSTPASPMVVSTEGSGVTGSVTVIDVAGNSATFTSAPVNIDKTGPTQTVVVAPAANANGWNSSPVTATFTCTDAGSGVPTATAPITFSAEGAAQHGDGICTDAAGNITTTSVTGINIDTTNPGAAITTPAAGDVYLLNQPVNALFACADNLSLFSCVGDVPSGTAIPTSSIGSAIAFTVTATDSALHTATAATSYSVKYGFGGFFAPLNGASPAGTEPTQTAGFAVGRVVPVAWQIKDFNGSLNLPSAITSFKAYANAACSGEPASGATSIDLMPGGVPIAPNNLTWDATNQRFVYNLDTSSLGSGGCYNLVLTLGDGNSYDTILHVTFVGFDAPAATAGPASDPSDSGSFTAGNTLSFSWRLLDGGGTTLLTNQPPLTIMAIPNSTCSGPGDGVAFQLDGVAGNSFTFDSGTGQYVFTWNTAAHGDVAAIPPGCYTVVLNFGDASGTTFATIVHLN